MPDLITERTADLEQGLNDLQQKSADLAAAPAVVGPPAAAPTPAGQASPVQVNIPVLPAPEPAPVVDTAPPRWQDITDSPKYQDATPQKKLVAFARWHDDTYNHLSSDPDWATVKDQFNNRAAQVGSELSKAAGGINPDEARVQLAHDALADAEKTAGQPLDKAGIRETLAPLGGDVAAAYYKSLQPDDSYTHSILNGIRNFGSEIGRGLEKSVQGLAQMSADAAKTGRPVEGGIGGWLGSAMMKLAPESARKEGAQFLQDAADYWKQRSDASDNESAVDPKLANTNGAIASRLAASVVRPLVNFPSFIAQHHLEAYADKYDETKDPAQAQAAANRATIGDTAWLGLGSATATGLNSVLETQGISGLRNWATRLSGAVGTNITAGQLIKAGEAAANAPEGEKQAAFGKAFNKLDLSDAAIQAAFGVIGAGLPPMTAHAQAEEVRTQGEGVAAATAAAGAPATAAVLRQSTEATATAVEQAPPQVQFHHNVDAEGNAHPQLGVPEGTTVEQLEAARDRIKQEAPVADQPEFTRQLDEAIAKAAPVAGAAPVAAATEPAGTEVTPAAKLESGSLVEPTGAARPTGQEWNAPILFTRNALENAALFLDRPEPRIDAAQRMRTELLEKSDTALPAPFRKIIQAADFSTPEGVRKTQTEIANLVEPKALPPETPVTDENLSQVAEQLGMKNPGRYPGVPILTMADPTHGGNISIPEGATVSEVARLQGTKAAQFAAKTPEEATAAHGADSTAIKEIKAAVAARRGDTPPARVLESKAPVGEAPPRPQFTRRTPEEQKAAEDTGVANVRAEFERTGILPKVSEIRRQTGNNAQVAWALHDELAGRAAEAPSVPVPAGATETSVKHPFTGDELPTATSAPDERGVSTVTPRFVNDPKIVAQMIDQGMISGDKGSRLYIPDELVDSEKVAPAIMDHAKFDANTKQFYVDGVDTALGHVNAPDQYTEAARRASQFQKAQATVFTDKDLTGLQEAQQGAESRTPAEVAMAREESADPELHVLSTAEGNAPDPLVKLENTSALDRIGISSELGAAQEGKAADVLRALTTDKGFPEGSRMIAQIAAKAGYALDRVKIIVVDTPDSMVAGSYHHGTHELRINAGGIHVGGVRATVLHELFHAALDGKLEPDAPRNAVEQAAYDKLKALHRLASAKLYQENFGRMPANEEELLKFQQAQVDSKGDLYVDRAHYGLADLREFVMETLTNPAFQRVLGSLKLDLPLPEASRFRSIIDAVKSYAKEVFTGTPVHKTSVLDHALDSAIAALQEGPTNAGRFDIATGQVRPAALTAEGRAQLQDASARATARAEGAQRAREETGMTPEELGTEISGGEPAARETGVTPAYIPRADVSGDGWVTPDGKFLQNTSDMRAADTRIKGVEVPQFGGHEEAAWQIIHNDPQLAAKFEATAEAKGYTDISEMNIGDIKSFMEDNGFLRVMQQGRDTFFTGKPKLNPEGMKLLDEHAITNERRLVHDRETTGINSQKELYRPPTMAEPRQLQSFAPTEEQPADEEQPAEVRYTRGMGGRRNLSIGAGATRAQLEGVERLIDSDAEAPPAVKQALKQQVEVAARQQEPVLVERTKVFGATLKDQGANIIVAGADSAQNMARITAERTANSVALDFGSANKPSKTALLDRAAMPFVVESAGDLNALKTDLDRVSNSRDPKLRDRYTEVVQHAIDNFDRLNALKGHDRVMKDQLQREQTFGIETPELNNYVTRLLDAPDTEDGDIVLAPNAQGGTRYFTKGRSFEKLADAIEAGFKPVTTDIVDLDRKRIETGERIIQQKILQESLKAVKAPDGRPIVSTAEPRQTLYQGTQQATPRGYQLINTHGAAPLVVHNDYAPLFKALYGERGNPQLLAQWAGAAKRNTLILDTFHVGRIGLKQLFYSGGEQRVGIGKGLSILEYSKADLQRAVDEGDITPKMQDYANANYEDAQALIANGLNVSKISDNLNAEHQAAIPFIKNFNPWVFSKLSRGAMLQTALENLARNESRFPELSRQEVLQRTSREMNEVFGNLQKQSVFKDPRYQEALRSIFLAPQWAESQFRAEARGFGQFGRAAVEATQGKLRLGTVAQGQLTAVIGTFAAMQVASLLLNGHTTFQNKKGDWFALHIPGGRAGFEFNPLEIPAENAFMFYRYASQHKDVPDILAQMGLNKLGPVSRGAAEFLLNRDYAGKRFESLADRTRASVTDAVVPGLLPTPIGLGAIVEHDPRQPFGYRLARAPGATEKTLLQSAGVKVNASLTPRGEMFALAHPYRGDANYGDNSPPIYRELRSALDNRNDNATISEINLLAKRGKTRAQILGAAGITAGGLQPEKFTGKKDTEALFVHALSKDNREIYNEAQADHRANAQRLETVLSKATRDDKDLAALLRKNAAKPTAKLVE